MQLKETDTQILSLGTPKIPSPLLSSATNLHAQSFVSDEERILVDINVKRLSEVQSIAQIPSFEVAGPRKHIYFDPSKLKCALVTCGGLCPGLNSIIRSIVLGLHHGYGVRNIFGIRYGLQGFIPQYGHDVVDLKPETVVHIHEMGGTILGSSRGPQPIEEVVDTLERMNIGILFMIGGDGTLVAATKIADAVQDRGLKISVVGIPKTIDNDIYLVARSFGFDTAVEVATKAIEGAHNESAGFPNGVGLIKLMGRYSGFIAATATLSKPDVNFVLIPEVDFDLEGPKGMLAALAKRLEQRRHAVVVVAEGAGQKFFEGKKEEYDESGNIRLNDIGLFLKQKITNYFQCLGVSISLKYIDPSYTIRSLAANTSDNLFCSLLGRDAVHAGMAGKTKVLIGHWNNQFVHLPMNASAGKRKHINPRGKLWHSVLETTGQGSLKNE